MQTAGRRCCAAFCLLAIIAYSGFERNRDDGEGTRRSTPDKAERPNFPLTCLYRIRLERFDAFEKITQPSFPGRGSDPVSLARLFKAGTTSAHLLKSRARINRRCGD